MFDDPRRPESRRQPSSGAVLGSRPGSRQPAAIPPRPLLTMRVSQDSGRTWGRTVLVYADECTPLITFTWPPCECPRHRRGEAR